MGWFGRLFLIISIIIYCGLPGSLALEAAGELDATAEEHVYGDWVTAKSARLLEPGEAYRVCGACGHIEYRTLLFPTILAPSAFIIVVLTYIAWSKARRKKKDGSRRRPVPREGSSRGYYDENSVYYSTMYGGGIYEWTGRMVQDPLGGSGGGSESSPLLVNIITKEEFFIKRADLDYAARSYYRERILAPPSRLDILWPCDMVKLTDEQQMKCSLFAEREYSETPKPHSQRKGAMGLLFPYGGYPAMISADRRLAQVRPLSWKNPRARAAAMGITAALYNLNRSGYIYMDFHFSRFFFLENGQVYFNFSRLAFATGGLNCGGAAKIQGMSPGGYPIEFAEPAIVRGVRTEADIQSQNYCLCAMLFYLLFGRHAYDGRLLSGYADDNARNHYVKFRNYHQMPLFIFDPENNQNALGAFDEEQRIIELWKECPDMLKEMFVQVLRQPNAERGVPVNNPSPAQWLECFKRLGWMEPTVKAEEGRQQYA